MMSVFQVPENDVQSASLFIDCVACRTESQFFFVFY